MITIDKFITYLNEPNQKIYNVTTYYHSEY